MKNKDVRSFTPEEVADVVEETVNETVKGMQNISAIIRLIAVVTQEVKDLLSHDKQIKIDTIRHARGGLTLEKGLAWKVLVTLKEQR